MNERESTRLAGRVADECLAYRVRYLNRVVTNIYDRALKPIGISANQANVLAVIALSDGASSADISRVMLMDKSTVSRTVDRMRKNGWIQIYEERNGPTQVISVTAEGRTMMAAAHGKWEKAQEEASARLGEQGVAAVRMLHDILMEGEAY